MSRYRQQSLGIQGDLAEYFKILVNIEHPDTRFPEKTNLELEKKLTNLRDRIRKKRKLSDANDPYRSEFFHMVYAACGNKSEGVSLEQIKIKAGLPLAQVEQTVKHLVFMDLLRFKKSKYIPVDSHLFFENLGESQAFKNLFLYLLNQSAEAAKRNFSSEKELFLLHASQFRKIACPN